MELKDIVMKLTRPIEPIGDSGIDAERLKNLGELTGLVEDLLSEIYWVGHQNVGRHESSRATAGEAAVKSLNYIKDEYCP